jgi:hypothetical protein
MTQPRTPARDTLADEIEAIAVIGRALGNITDPAVRRRILAWATECFLSEPPARTADAPTARRAAAADTTLAVDAIGEMFSASTSSHEDLAIEPRVEPQADAPVKTLVHGFVTDFQRLVVEWQGA